MKLSEILARFKTDVETAVAVVGGVQVLTNVHDERAMNDKTVVINIEPIGDVGLNSSFAFVNIFSTSVDFVEANRVAQLAFEKCSNIRDVPGLNLSATQLPSLEAVFSDYTTVSVQFRVRYQFED